MAYDRQEILKQAIAAIEKNELTTVAEVLNYLPISLSILYETEDWKLEVLEPIKKKLESTRTKLKEGMKRKWMKSKSPLLQLISFKLIANDEELAAINSGKDKGTIKGTGDFELNLNL